MALVELLTAPYDSGVREVRMGRGPDALLEAGLIERLEAAGVTPTLTPVDLGAEFRGEIAAAFELHRQVARALRAPRAAGRLPITLSGNCNTGVLAALAHNTGADLGIVWFDAHSDAETPETSTSGFLDGMGLAMALGRCWRPMLEDAGIAPVPGCRVVLVGAREISEAAGRLLGDTGVAVIPPAEVREAGIAAGIDQLRKAGVTRLHVHVDVDVLDCDRVGRANAYALPDGLMPDQLVAAIRSLTGAFALTSASLASYDPETDPSGRVAEAAVQTLVEIASSAQPG